MGTSRGPGGSGASGGSGSGGSGGAAVKVGPALVADREHHGGSAAGLLEFAVAQILRDDTTLGALPAVLERLVATFGLRAALAFQPSGGQPAAVLAVHPAGSVEPSLLARIGALSLAQRDPTAALGGPVELPAEGSPDAAAVNLLLAYSVPVGGQCLCALALIGDTASWDDEIRSTAHAVAAVVASQLRHANDLARLAERQELTRALIQGSPTAILAADDRGRLVEFNRAAEELSGYLRDDVLGQSITEILVPERDRPSFREHLSAYTRTGPAAPGGQMRVATLQADGTERTVELTPVPITVNGQAIFTGFLRDLSELERSHAALADQTERLNCLISSAIPGILITDERGLITHVSRSFGILYGIDAPERLVGTRGAAVIRRIQRVFADPGAFTRRSLEVLRARQPVSGEQFGCADGRTIECDYWPVVVDARWRGDLWLSWDMSDRTEVDRQRQQMLETEREQNARLRKVDDARNQFLAIVSHELRTPLTSIVSFCELIRGEAEGLTEEGLRFLDIIERNADRLHRLIGDLLMLDRVEAGALPLDLEEVSIPELTAEAVRAASSGAAKQGVTIVLSTGEGPAVQGDSRRLTQVLDNLLSNAVKFSHRNGLVRVAARCEGRTWRIDVADSGIGIPPAEADQLFNRFVRASNARTAGLPGIGLGLSIVKILSEMHGGHVEVHSVLGLGSTFSVYLPAEP
jgi:PAS domain S-box-containing protein